MFSAKESSEKDYFFNSARGCAAKGYYDASGFTLVAGSLLAASASASYQWRENRQQLLAAFAEKTPSGWLLKQNYTFASPSAAAGFCNGRSSNGWQEWRNKAGATLDEIYRK